jgi:hypothetical protein
VRPAPPVRGEAVRPEWPHASARDGSGTLCRHWSGRACDQPVVLHAAWRSEDQPSRAHQAVRVCRRWMSCEHGCVAGAARATHRARAAAGRLLRSGALHSLAEACRGRRRHEFEDVTAASAWPPSAATWSPRPQGELFILALEGDPLGAVAKLAASDHPFDCWFEERAREVHSVDPVGGLHRPRPSCMVERPRPAVSGP